MKQRVVSLCWGTAWERYGQTFVETFRKHWPDDVEFALVTDEIRDLPGVWEISLEHVDGYRRFMDRWADDPMALGLESKDIKAVPGERFWKQDAVKWAPQGLAPRMALEGLEDGDVLAWFDADVETTAPVPNGWISTLLDGHDVACLQRPGRHTEIGFWAMRMGRSTRLVIEAFARMYETGTVFSFREYHSAFIFDRALEMEPELKIRNLAEGAKPSHPWPQTVLAQYTVHKKGNRKG